MFNPDDSFRLPRMTTMENKNGKEQQLDGCHADNVDHADAAACP